MNYLPGLFTPVVCKNFIHSIISVCSILITFSRKWKLRKHVNEGWTCTLFGTVCLLLEPNRIEWKTDQAINVKIAQIPPLITSVSSCTSSIVGHGSAICARGIVTGFSVSPSAAQMLVSTDFGGAAPVKCSFTPVQSPGTEDLSALGSPLGGGDAHAEATSLKELYKQL